MHFEMAASIGLVLFVFLLIQITRMRSISRSDSKENSGDAAVPVYISERIEKGQIRISNNITEEKYINNDTLN